MEVVKLIAFIVSAIVLLAVAGLASVAFRGGEFAGYHQPAVVSGPGPRARRRPGRWMVVNQVLVWGAALTLLAATVVLVVATIVNDSLHWP